MYPTIHLAGRRPFSPSTILYDYPHLWPKTHVPWVYWTHIDSIRTEIECRTHPCPEISLKYCYRLPQGYQTSRVAPSWAHPAPPWAPMNPTLSITFPGPWGPLFGPPYHPNSPLLCPNRELSLNLTCFSVGSQTCFQVGKLSKHLSNFHQSKSQSVEICQASMKSSS